MALLVLLTLAIGAGAVVTKHTVIGDGETWAGVPARRYVAGVAV